MPKRSPALLLAEALTFHGRYGAETEDQAANRRLQRNQMAATELLRLDALRLELQTQLADYKEACTKAETRADQAEGRAKLLACAWIKATDAVPQESDGEVFVRFTDGSIGTGWATYWHGASNDFAHWTFPDPDEFRLVSEWTKNVPASPGMHWTENEPVRLPQARTGRVYLAGPMMEHSNAPEQEVVIPQGYEIHELPPDYSGPVWIESQVRQLARQTACASQPITDAGVVDAQDVGLTDEEIEAIAKKHMSTVGDHWCNEDAIRERHAEDFARAIIAALRAKGQS